MSDAEQAINEKLLEWVQKVDDLLREHGLMDYRPQSDLGIALWHYRQTCINALQDADAKLKLEIIDGLQTIPGVIPLIVEQEEKARR